MLPPGLRAQVQVGQLTHLRAREAPQTKGQEAPITPEVSGWVVLEGQKREVKALEVKALEVKALEAIAPTSTPSWANETSSMM